MENRLSGNKSISKSEKTIKKRKEKKRDRIDPFLYSPSRDNYFSHLENIRAMEEGFEQIKRGECKTYTAKEIRESLGL